MSEKINVQFTIFRKDEGLLTKRIFLNDVGAIGKDSSQCFLSNGKGIVHRCGFKELQTLIPSLQKNECIAHGVFDDEKYGDENGVAGIVTKNQKQEEYNDNNLIISRTLDYFSYPTSNAFTMFDYDVEDGEEIYTVEEYIRIMASMVPGFDKCAKIVLPSTSSCINDRNDNPLSGSKPSFHMYYPVKDATDLKRFKEVLFKRCWLKGHGIIRTDVNKVPLNRTIFDDSVFSPERLDFVAGAYCEDGLIQRLPVLEYYEGNVLDTFLLENLTDEEEIEYKRVLHNSRQPYLQEYESHKEKRIFTVKEQNDWSEQKARNYINDLDECILWNGFSLNLDTGKTITVKELLNDGKKYDGVTMPDPHEPEKGRNKAKFFWNDGNGSIIHSFIHGGRNYTFKRDTYGGKAKPKRTEKDPTFGGFEDFISKKYSRHKLSECYVKFFGKSFFDQLIIMNAGIGKTRSFMKALSDALQTTKGLFSIRVGYFVPDNDLSHELLQEYHKEKSLVGMPCMIRGRGHHNEHLKPPCKWAELFLKSDISEKEYRSKVSLIDADFCSQCRFKANCEYLHQFERAKSAHLIFFPHQYLFTMTAELKELVSTITHLVVDEDIVGSHILNNDPGVGVFSCDRQESNIIKGIIDDVEHGAEIKHVLGKWKSEITDEYKKYRNIRKPNLAKTIRDLNSSANVDELAKYRKKENQRSFWRLLKKSCAKLDQSPLNFTPLSVNNVWVDGNELRIGIKTDINSLWSDKKMLYLDASADPEIVQQALGKKFKVTQIKTHYTDRFEIKQVYDNQYTSSHLKNNYQKIFTSLNSYFGGSIPPFITTKEIEELVKKELVDSKILSGHFKNIRGTDDFKNCEKLLVVGRYQINGEALKEKARMLYPNTEEPLNFDYIPQEFIYRMKDGVNMATTQRDYIIGSDVWRLNNHLSRSETEQAIARIRMFDVEEGKKKTVYLLTSQVLDITTSELISSSEFTFATPRETGNEIQDAILGLLKSNSGVLRWKPKNIYELTGIPVSSLNEAKKASWFINNPYWNLHTATYQKTGRQSRKTNVTDKLILLDVVDVDDSIVEELNPYEPVEKINITNNWN